MLTIILNRLSEKSFLMSKTEVFLRKLNAVEFVPDNSYLVLLDVKSLYTSIPIAEAIKAVKKSLENHLKRRVATKVITTFKVITIFNSTNYLKTKGCAMGAICTPSYANIFMDHFEKNLYTQLRKGSH